MHFILQSKRELRRATNANKIIIDKREAKDNAREAREIEVKARRTKANTKANARANAKATTIATITTTIAIHKKQLSKLRKRFACTYVSLVLKIASMLLSCLLLFNNSRKYINNTLYN